MRILHTMLRLGDLERAIDFYSNHGRRSLDKASYFRAYEVPSDRGVDHADTDSLNTPRLIIRLLPT